MIAHFVPVADGMRMAEIVRNNLLSEFEVRCALAIELF
jgi:hypothetical protein